MSRLDRYLLRLFALRFAAVLALLIVMLELENYTRLTRLIEHAPHPLALLGRFSLYLLPEYLGVGLLVALFLGVALGVRAAVLAGEWQIFHAAGIAPLRLALLPILLGCLCAVAEAAIQLEYRPLGEDAVDHLTEDLRLGRLGIGGEVGTFIDLGNGATLRLGSFDMASGRLGNVFLSQGPTVLDAREGQAAFDRFGNLILLLRDGEAFVRAAPAARGAQRERRFTFGRLELVVPLAPAMSSTKIESVEIDRLTLRPLLLRAALDRMTHRAEHPALAALAARLAFAWAALLLPFVALVLGAPRQRGRTAFGVALGILLLVGFLKLTDFLRSAFLEAPLVSFGAAMSLLTLGTWALWRGEAVHGVGYVEASLENRLGRTIVAWMRRFRPART